MTTLSPITDAVDAAVSDAVLVAGVRAGDVRAQEQLWRRHAELVWRICRSHLDAHDAEDATADTFVEVVRTISSFDASRGTLAGWVAGVAVTQVRRRRRSSSTFRRLVERVSSSGDSRSVGPDHADAAIARADAQQVRHAMRQLSADDRLVLVTQAAGDLDSAALGRALGVAPGAAKVRLHRARSRLAALVVGERTDENGATR